MMTGQAVKPHFLMLPFTEQGHINPMLSLASQLAKLGCRVTFVKAGQHKAEADSRDVTHGAELESPGGGALQFVTLGAGTPPPHRQHSEESANISERESVEAFEKILEGLEERQVLVAHLLKASQASSHPISAIVADFFMWKWVSPLALALGLPLSLLVACSATFFYMLHLEQKGKYSEIEDLLVSRFGMPRKVDDGLSSSKDTPEVKEQMTNFFHSLFEGIEDAGHMLLVNSFKLLEAPLLPFLEASRIDLRFIGPCLPTWNGDHVALGNNMAQRAGSAFSEEEACLPWLDKQEKGSVLFVSFGSQSTMRAKEQMEELAMGIEKSGHKFLWVVRSDAPVGSRPPEAFHKRINGGERGMFVSWVPQKRVLEHAAVGGFLTHSGWNSTLESLTFGVPMLCLPVFGDQPLNANLVQGYLQVGLRLGPSQDELVKREEVERGVRAIMEGRFTGRVSQFRQAAQSAIIDAQHTLASFVQTIADVK